MQSILSGRVLIKYLKSYKIQLVYIPLIIYWIVLLIATSIPADRMPSVGVGDKFSHFFAYLILSALLYFAFSLQEKYSVLKNNPALISAGIASAYGIFDELHQMLIPGRSAELLDWVADFCGALAGVLIARQIYSRLDKT